MVSLHFIFAFVCCFRNFVSVELATKNHLAAGAIKFQVRKTGNPFHILHLHSFQRNHPVMNDILDKLATEFSGSEWGANGPLQLTKAMRKYCEDQMWSSKDGDTISRCKDVTVFKEEHFYPINWRQWPWMFNVKFIKTKLIIAKKCQMRMIKHFNLMTSTCEPRLWVTTEHGEIFGETDRNTV